MDESASPARPVLDLIRSRFAGAEAAIERGYRRDPSFRSLCEDYRDCLSTLEHIRQGARAGEASRCEEYEELLDELDTEIRAWIAAHDPD